MIYGYARVSTDGQSVDAQVRQLTKAGCKKVFREVASGAKTDRAQLRRLLGQLVIWFIHKRKPTGRLFISNGIRNALLSKTFNDICSFTHRLFLQRLTCLVSRRIHPIPCNCGTLKCENDNAFWRIALDYICLATPDENLGVEWL